MPSPSAVPIAASGEPLLDPRFSSGPLRLVGTPDQIRNVIDNAYSIIQKQDSGIQLRTINELAIGADVNISTFQVALINRMFEDKNLDNSVRNKALNAFVAIYSDAGKVEAAYSHIAKKDPNLFIESIAGGSFFRDPAMTDVSRGSIGEDNYRSEKDVKTYRELDAKVNTLLDNYPLDRVDAFCEFLSKRAKEYAFLNLKENSLLERLIVKVCEKDPIQGIKIIDSLLSSPDYKKNHFTDVTIYSHPNILNAVLSNDCLAREALISGVVANAKAYNFKLDKNLCQESFLKLVSPSLSTYEIDRFIETNKDKISIAVQTSLTIDSFHRERSLDFFVGKVDNKDLLVQSPSLRGLGQAISCLHKGALLPNGDMQQAKDFWIAFEKLPEAERARIVEDAVQISKLLYHRGLPVEVQSVNSAFSEIKSLRNSVKDVALFKDRSVLVLAHLETREESAMKHPEKEREGILKWMNEKGYVKDSPCFGDKILIDSIKKQTDPNSVELVRAKSEIDTARAKEEFLKRFATMPPGAGGFTFFFDGHSGPDAIYLSHGRTEDLANSSKIWESCRITVSELAKAIIERNKNFPPSTRDPSQRDIYISDGCYSTDFIDSLAKEIAHLPVQPIMISVAETGQYGRSSYSGLSDVNSISFGLGRWVDEKKPLLEGVSEGGASLFSKVKNLFSSKEAAKEEKVVNKYSNLSDILDSVGKTFTNPNLFVPKDLSPNSAGIPPIDLNQGAPVRKRAERGVVQVI